MDRNIGLKQLDRVIIATSNEGKRKEFEALLSAFGISVLSNKDLDGEWIPHVIEDGKTFEENALKKATAYFQRFRLPALADDSGLEVDCLGGEPGVFSARFAGEGSSDQENIQLLLQRLQGVPFEQRSARFTCAIALVTGEEPPLIAKGYCSGYILDEQRGTGGFGYDPVFYVPDHNCTFAEMSREQKNRLSHRYRALQELKQQLQVKLDD